MFVALSITTLVSGILNILLGLGWTVSIVVGTIGIGLICTPITILPVVLGIFEILYAVKLLANPPQPVQPSQTIAILEICCIVLGGVIEAGVGIFALVAYSDTSVKQYFEKINS
jgi:uncharacterized membrane protein